MAENQQHGFVVGTVVTSQGDTPADDDRWPDLVPAEVQVHFDRVQGQEVQHDPARIVSYRRITARILPDTGELTGDLDAEGNLITDEDGQVISRPGVWLTVGHYSLTFSGDEVDPPEHPLVVTAEHTPQAPLNIVVPYEHRPAPGAPVQVLVLPPGPHPEAVLGWDAVAGMPTWRDAPEGIGDYVTAAELAQALGTLDLAPPDTGWIAADTAGTGAVMHYRRLGNVVYLGVEPSRLGDPLHILMPGSGVLWDAPVGYRPAPGPRAMVGVSESGAAIVVNTLRNGAAGQLRATGGGRWFPGGCYVTDDPFPGQP